MPVKGQPLANIAVLAGVAGQPQNLTYNDEHHVEGAVTRTDGTYDLAATTPWVGEFFADMPGRDEARVDGRPGEFLPPGRYDLQFAAPKVVQPETPSSLRK